MISVGILLNKLKAKLEFSRNVLTFLSAIVDVQKITIGRLL